MADFDVKAARAAGYSDDEILSHLTQSRQFNVDAAVKSGYSKEDIINHLSGAPPAPNKPVTYGHEGYKSPMPSFLGHADEAMSDSVNALAEGAQKLFGHNKTTDERLGGASQMGRGLANAVGPPLLLESGVAAPVRTAVGLATGLIGQKAGSTAAKIAGAGQGTQNFVGDATGLTTGLIASRLPLPDAANIGRAASATKAGTKAAVLNAPIIGRPLRAGIAAAREDFAKSDPTYVDPKMAEAAAKAEAGIRAREAAKSKIAKEKADQAQAEADAAKVADKQKALDLRQRVDAAPSEASPNPSSPPTPDLNIPKLYMTRGGRMPGTGAPAPTPEPTPPPTRVPLWQRGQPIMQSPPEMTQQQPAGGPLPSGRIPGPVATLPVQEAPARVPIWQNNQPSPVNLKMTPQQPAAGQLPSGRAPGQIPESTAQAPEVEQAYPLKEYEAGTGAKPTAAPKESYAAAARTVKARAMARWLKTGGATAEDVAKLSPEDWESVAKEAGVNKPSKDSIQQALTEFQSMQPPPNPLTRSLYGKPE